MLTYCQIDLQPVSYTKLDKVTTQNKLSFWTWSTAAAGGQKLSRRVLPKLTSLQSKWGGRVSSMVSWISWRLCILVYAHASHIRNKWIIIACPSKKSKILQSKKVSNTGLKSSLRTIERYAYCLGYWYFTPRYGFPKSNGTRYPLFTMERVALRNIS